MLVPIVAMLTKLVERFDPYQYRVRENAPSLAGPFEHEDDDEPPSLFELRRVRKAAKVAP
jgi:hypothetical protein